MKDKFENLSADYTEKSFSYYGINRKEMIQFIPKELNTFLDVGCGEGAFGALLKKVFSKSKIYGIEPHFNSMLKAKEVMDTVIHSSFNEAAISQVQEKIDCVIFNDVLEHLTDPKEALILSKAILSKEGFVLASIPNILYFPVFFNEIIAKQDWKYANAGILDKTHLRFFTKKSIERLFESAGYEIVKIQGINMGLTRLYRVLNFFLLNKIHNWRYLQFAVLAKQK
ncbi:class I SAM-dependent methyltransferase [Niabella hirudinis]|uniref:class I SAM-dependent methyltransferase n=1 Tax=Niabella hirudinis TaxID=1285929 RepID=UPI003EB85BAD